MRRWKSLYWTVRLWLERQPWSLIAAMALSVAMLAFVFLLDEPPWLSGMKGNFIGEVMGGVVFLLLGFHFGRKIESIILRRADLEDQRERMNAFIRFLESEGHYNVVFPDLVSEAHPDGLMYRLEPVRHEGKAVKRETDIDTSYIVRVARPAYEDVLEPAQFADYERSPIRIGGLYFCRFYNREWHMGQSTFGRGWHKFHLFGKHGQMEHSLTAEEFYAAETKAAEGK